MADAGFILKPSSIHGVGVFAVRDFAVGEHLPLFSEDYVVLDEWPEPPLESYCFESHKGIIAPPDFTRMSVGWYLNNSDEPNATHVENYEWFASRVIKAGDEVTIDYRTLSEE